MQHEVQGRRPRGQRLVSKVGRSGVRNWVSHLVFGWIWENLAASLSSASSSLPQADSVRPAGLLWAPGELTQVKSQDQAWRGGDARAGCLLLYGRPHRGDSEAVRSQSFYALVPVPSVSLRTPRPLCYLPLRVPCVPQCLARRRHSKHDYGIKSK